MAQMNAVPPVRKNPVRKNCSACEKPFDSRKCSNGKFASRCPSCNDKHYGRPRRQTVSQQIRCYRCHDAPAEMTSHGAPRCSACVRTEAAPQSVKDNMCPTCPNGLRCLRDDKRGVLSTWCRDCNFARYNLPQCATTDMHQPSQKCPNFVFKRYDGTYANYCYACWTEASYHWIVLVFPYRIICIYLIRR